jgi:hypothetical protein
MPRTKLNPATISMVLALSMKWRQAGGNAMFEKLFYSNALVNVFLESRVPLSFTLGGLDENIKPTDSEISCSIGS